MPGFQITTRGIPARAEEWFLASNMPQLELPQLSEQDRRRAQIRHMTDEQYARRLVLRAAARKRESDEAERIGGIIETLFGELGGKFKLSGILKRGFEPGWHALIESHSHGKGWSFDVLLPTEDFSDKACKQVLNASDSEEVRAYLLAELDRAEGQKVAS